MLLEPLEDRQNLPLVTPSPGSVLSAHHIREILWCFSGTDLFLSCFLCLIRGSLDISTMDILAEQELNKSVSDVIMVILSVIWKTSTALNIRSVSASCI